MEDLPEIVVVVGAAEQDVRSAIERRVIGDHARIFIADADERWAELELREIDLSAEPVWMGLDLAVGADMTVEMEVERKADRFVCRRYFDVPEIREVRRTHPTTARELRRAERQRRR